MATHERRGRPTARPARRLRRSSLRRSPVRKLPTLFEFVVVSQVAGAAKQWHRSKKRKLKEARQNAALSSPTGVGPSPPVEAGNALVVQDSPMDITGGGGGADGDKKIIIEDFVEVKPNVLNEEPVKVSDLSLLSL